MPEFWWSELLCSYFVGESWNTSIGFFWGLLRWGKKMFWGQKRWRVWSRWRWNISQQQTELRTCRTLELWLQPGWSKGHSSNRKWHGGGCAGSARQSSCFLIRAFPFPHSPWLCAGSRDDGGRKWKTKSVNELNKTERNADSALTRLVLKASPLLVLESDFFVIFDIFPQHLYGSHLL